MIDLSPLDRLSLIMERRERPLDFALVLQLENVDLASLQRGAQSAALAFPRSAMRAAGDRWVPDLIPPISTIALDSTTRFDPRAAAPIAQSFDASSGKLLTRSHHAAADLLSVVLWLDHQLAVATGVREPLQHAAPPTPLALKHHKKPARKSRFAHAGPSRKLWTRSGAASPERRVLVRLVSVRRVSDDFTYTDHLGAAMLRAIGEFQEARGAPRDRLSLWFPINIRADPFDGFGNGASRIRVYDRSPRGASLRERALSFREQVRWSKDHGEWFVPQKHPLFSLPEPLIRAYFRRPWVDMGTIMFSHLERIRAAKEQPMLPGARSVEVISMLDPRHPLGVAAMTLRGETALSFTWDPAQLAEEDVTFIADRFARAVDDA